VERVRGEPVPGKDGLEPPGRDRRLERPQRSEVQPDPRLDERADPVHVVHGDPAVDPHRMRATRSGELDRRIDVPAEVEHELVRFEIGRRAWLALALQVPRSRHEHARHDAEPTRDQRGVGKAPEPDRHIDALLDQIEETAPQRELDLDLRSRTSPAPSRKKSGPVASP